MGGSRLAPIVVLVTLALTGPYVAADQAAKPAEPELRFLNWSEYIDPEVVLEFEQKFGVRVKEVYFESDDTRDNMLAETGGRGYDLVMVNGARLQAYRKGGWLAPLTAREVPNLRHLDPRWVDAFPEAAGYAVPYFWGTLGIAYRSDLVPEPITTWKQLFRPPESLRGKILMIKAHRDLIGMALKALGYSANATEPKQLAEAERLLLAQKPFVHSYSSLALSEDSGLVTGDFHAAMSYSGDALMVSEHNPNIRYVVPEEGSNLWVDYLTVLASSPRKELAAQFINFLHEPQNFARIAEFVYYASPNRAAEKLLPSEFLEDPVIYPSPALLDKCEVYATLPPRAVKRWNAIFARVIP